MAGLLTDFLPDAFPTWHYHNKSVAKVIIKKLNEASQQRDCPGFSPDSLLFPIPNDTGKTNPNKGRKIIQIVRLGDKKLWLIIYIAVSQP